MKKTCNYLLVGFILSVLSSCWEDYYVNVEQEVGTDEIIYNVDAAGETITIPIRCNTDWFIWNPPYWIIPNVESGSGDCELSVEVSPNTFYARLGEINIIAGTELETINISQQKTSGELLAVTTERYTKFSSRVTDAIGVNFSVKFAHLASEAGVIVNGKTYVLGYGSSINEGNNYLTIRGISNSGSYKAYAKDKKTGLYTYGESKSYQIK